MSLQVASSRIRRVIEDIKAQYTEEEVTCKPWIIGFSGGKDSTVLLTLTWWAMRELQEAGTTLKRQVYVVRNDTLVENPIIDAYVGQVLSLVKQAAHEQRLPIETVETTPSPEDSFWYCVIGKGYPVPNNTFRYCTERLKIKPTSTFIERSVERDGAVIVLIGTRRAESELRRRSIEKHEVKGQRLSPHPLNPNTYMYAPLKDLMLEEVWWILHSIPSPWGGNNEVLYTIYRNASADDYECPTMVTNAQHGACGQSRFGCWVCTVVKEDRSMTGLIESGITWMRPLLAFRNRLQKERNVSAFRNSTRRNGQRAVDETGHNLGNYTIAYRQQLLHDLFKIQKSIQKERPNVQLITSQELIAIQVQWYRDGCFDTTVNDLYEAVYGYAVSHNELDTTERELLTKVCGEKKKAHYGLIQNLLALQRSKILLLRKVGLQHDIENRLTQFLKEREHQA